ncbi:MAG: hypothetical protein J6S14_20840 [Clostridia bacterium]|nr:hypothetical protein [Clostridia bacterium]
MIFSSVAALKVHIEKQVAKVLANEVADVVRDVQKEAIEEEVYGVYPRTVKYDRRKDNGGLSDEDNMLADVKGTVLRIRNVTRPNDEYDAYDTQFADDGCERSYVFDLPALIEYGDAGAVGYTHKHSSMPSGPTFLEPRPFVARTREELQKHGYHVNALRYGLIKAGFKVK